MEERWLQRFAEGNEGGGEGEASSPQEGAGPLEQRPQEDNPMVRTHWQRVDRIYTDWMEQAEALKQLFPDFDIRQELLDQRFQKMLLGGVDISSAYQALHVGQILPAAMEYAARTVEARLASAMRSGMDRPGENGLGGGAAALVGRNVTQLTRQDYDRYCRMVERGERVSFG